MKLGGITNADTKATEFEGDASLLRQKYRGVS